MNTKILEKLGKNLKKYRKIKGYTQEYLAEKVSKHQTYIGKLELGMCNPSIKLLYAITRALDIKLTDLFDFDN